MSMVHVASTSSYVLPAQIQKERKEPLFHRAASAGQLIKPLLFLSPSLDNATCYAPWVMRNERGKRSLAKRRALLLAGAVRVGGGNFSWHHAAAFVPRSSCCDAQAKAGRRGAKSRHCRHHTQGRAVDLNMAVLKRHRSIDPSPKISFGMLPDFLQKDPLLVTQKTPKEDLTLTQSAKKEPRRDAEMMVMSVASLALAVGVVYALASNTPDMFQPNDIEDSKNAAKNLMREGDVERLGSATRNIIGQVLPESAEEVIAVSIGEGISGVIGAGATWLVGELLSLKSKKETFVTSLPMNEAWKVSGSTSNDRMNSEKVPNNLNSLVSETVANGDYFLTQAAAQPLLEGVGIPAFASSLVSVLIATLPYGAVKLTAQKRMRQQEEQLLLNMLLEEEESRRRDMTVFDKMSGSMLEFIQQLNVEQTVKPDNELDTEAEKNLQRVQQQPEVPVFDFVEFFADLTRWLEYDVLSNNYRGVLTLPYGVMPSGLESAVFG